MDSLRTHFFITLFCLLVAVAVLHGVGSYFFWYWLYAPFDLLMHAIGGAWIAGMVLWIYYLSGYVNGRRGAVFAYGIACMSVFVVGALWEVFEVMIQATYVDYEHYLFDTATDFVADFAGALLITKYFLIKKRRLTI